MDDVRQVHTLLQKYADQKLLLGRSISSLYDHLRDFFVWDEGDRNSLCTVVLLDENYDIRPSLGSAKGWGDRAA